MVIINIIKQYVFINNKEVWYYWIEWNKLIIIIIYQKYRRKWYWWKIIKELLNTHSTLEMETFWDECSNNFWKKMKDIFKDRIIVKYN